MPQARLPMRKIKEVLRLHSLGLSNNQISGAVGISRSTVREYLQRAERAAVSWPDAEAVADVQLELELFGEQARALENRVAPDWAQVKRELAGKAVTLQLLHAEYTAEVGEGAYSYSRFCDLFRRFESTVSPSMRQRHKAGEKLYVDWAGMTVPIVDSATGEVLNAQIFVATMGASSFTFARAYLSQAQRNWTSAHVAAFEFLGGVPEIIVPDNTRTAITSPSRYDPEVNIAYADLARHYGVAVVPARVRHPKDKPKVEVAVQVIERDVLAPLRKMTFFGLDELNQAIKPLLDAVNNRVMKAYDASRRALFESIDAPRLQALPAERFEYAEWTRARVSIDYHVTVDKHHYSVPFRLIGKQLEVRLTARIIEVYDRNVRVASHARSFQHGGHTTRLNDMPSSHRRYAEWSPQRLVRWAAETGPAVALVVEKIIADKPHPEMGFRSALGVMRLGKRYGTERLEAACVRAQTVGAVRYQSIKTMLERGLDQQPLPETAQVIQMPKHPNIRGGDYFTLQTKKAKDPEC